VVCQKIGVHLKNGSFKAVLRLFFSGTCLCRCLEKETGRFLKWLSKAGFGYSDIPEIFVFDFRNTGFV
jgi:hypothetical protein